MPVAWVGDVQLLRSVVAFLPNPQCVPTAPLLWEVEGKAPVLARAPSLASPGRGPSSRPVLS